MEELDLDSDKINSDWIRFLEKGRSQKIKDKGQEDKYNVSKSEKIEIDLTTLHKGEKRVWVRPTTKRKGHYRKVKGAKVEIEKDKSNNMIRIENILSIVDLPDVSEDKLGSIASALENTLGKYATNVRGIRWATSDENEMHGEFGAMLTSKFDLGSISIVINKDIVDDTWFVDRYEKRDLALQSIKETQIEYFEDSIKLGMGEKEEYEDKLKGYKVMNRSSVDANAKDYLKCVIEHEGFHAIDFKNAVSSSPTVGGIHAGKFIGALEKNNVSFEDKCKVSEYATRSDTELWAEVGSALSNGVSIPESIENAFNDVLLQLK